MSAPTVSATCGAPVTVTDSLKSTVTAITSPAMKLPLAPCPVPERVTPATVGATVSEALPSTTASPSVMAWEPRPSAASLSAASFIVPPFSARAEPPMPRPFASVSAAATV